MFTLLVWEWLTVDRDGWHYWLHLVAPRREEPGGFQWLQWRRSLWGSRLWVWLRGQRWNRECSRQGLRELGGRWSLGRTFQETSWQRLPKTHKPRRPRIQNQTLCTTITTTTITNVPHNHWCSREKKTTGLAQVNHWYNHHNLQWTLLHWWWWSRAMEKLVKEVRSHWEALFFNTAYSTRMGKIKKNWVGCSWKQFLKCFFRNQCRLGGKRQQILRLFYDHSES